MPRPHALSLAALLLVAGTGAAFPQAQRTITVAAGKETSVATVTALRKDCSIGDLAGIKVTSPPKNGEFVVKSGKAKTPASYRCPNVETPIQALVYKPKSGFTGTDEVKYETRTIEGTIETRTVKITVDKGKAGSGGIVDL